MKPAAALTIALLLVGSASVAFADTTEENFTKLCASCHGKDGKASTKMGEKLKIKDFTDAKVQAGFTDDQAAKDIADGLKDKDTGKVTMPPRKDKLSADQIKDLVKLVRGFKAK
jgi:mono/diheme cytochrome c family protein